MPNRRIILAVSASLLLLAVAAPAADEAATSFKQEFLANWDQLEKKIVGLAEAIPQEKYSWRPAEGVRSVSEALMHVAGANFFFPSLVGVEAPEGGGDLEKITDKEKVIETLKKSFAHTRSAIENTPESDFDNPVKMFGQESSVRGAYFATAQHTSEHLGQLIAYARSNDVTPPWSQ